MYDDLEEIVCPYASEFCNESRCAMASNRQNLDDYDPDFECMCTCSATCDQYCAMDI